MSTERKVRRAQAITPSGVGAIIDAVGESFVCEDVNRWVGPRDVLRAPRIAGRFGVRELRVPPAATDGRGGLPYYRFPEWLFCGQCRAMSKWNPRREKLRQPPRCEKCRVRPPQLVPMRFIAACGNGHLDDVDWIRWAHSYRRNREQSQCGMKELQFRHVSGVGGGLESLEVRCVTCKAGRDLSELTGPDSLRRIGQRCSGRQPWQTRTEARTCDEIPVVLQRGASSVYFPNVGSAIDLPPESDFSSWGGAAGRIEHNDNFKLLLSRPDHKLRDEFVRMIAEEENVLADEVLRTLMRKLGEVVSNVAAGGIDDLPWEEWLALTTPPETNDPRDHFIARVAEFPSATGHGTLDPVVDTLVHRIRDVVLVDRLREIRVLQGFHRHTMKTMVPADLGARAGFLPAIEVFGEGVFIRFDEQEIATWSNKPRVQQRCNRLRRRLAASFRSKWLSQDMSPRLLLLHTFAHLLMRQMAFDAGYSSSSLRERLYAAEPSTEGPSMAGVLIYTAAGDSEGTLGGLARLGEADRLVPTLAAALATGQWCSLDPVCRESTAQGPDGLSLAACHACALAAETSCVKGNVLLDRMLLVDEEFGFFREPLAALLKVRTAR
ncbi:DUF1998 domain-containing protein [Polymorphospora rubra]|uniref:DUF1998 domain-containing protein n=1 Tax=Polymorphospora rubra TaxID=338584 RepID=UPI0033E8F44F